MNHILSYSSSNMLLSNSSSNTSALYIGNCLLVDPDGYPYVEWMYNLMGQCVHSPLEQSSFYVGLASLGLYIISGIPQVIENFMKGKAEGLSPYTLAMFIIGDSSNLLGAILTHQLFTQILLAIYFVTIEVILIAQFVFYKLKELFKRKKHKGQDQLRDDDEDEKKHGNTHSCTSMTNTPLEEHNNEFLSDSDEHHHQHGIAFKNSEDDEGNLKQLRVNSTWMISMLVSLMVFVYFMMNLGEENTQEETSSLTYGRKLLSIEQVTQKDHNSVQFPPVATEAIIGYTIGFISTTCSIGSRIAQIIKNFMKGTYGMNPLLFGCSVFGNILYSSSIFLFSVDGSFLMFKIPWLTSSLVNICLDSFIIAQYVFFTFIKKKMPEEKPQENSVDMTEQTKNNQQAIEEKLKALEV